MSTPRGNLPLVLGIVGILLVAVAIGFVLSSRAPTPIPVPPPQTAQDPNAPPPQTRFTPAQFRVAVEAVAATEEADFERARKHWADLLEIFPDDPDLRINQAVAVLKWIGTIDQALNSNDGKTSPADRERLLQEIDSAYAQASLVTDELAQLEQVDSRVPLIRSAILTSKASRVPYPEDMALHKQAAEILATALKQDPSQPLLATSFDESLNVLAGTAPELESQRADFLYAGWQAMPRNLFLLRRAADALLDAQDPRLQELLQPSLDITRPTWSMLQRQIDSLKPEELVPQAVAAIQAGAWDQTRKLRFWFNLLTATPGFNADNKLVKPDPLALLDTSFLLRLAPEQAPSTENDSSATAAGGSDHSPTLPAYQPQQTTTAAATAAAWYDFDFDLRSDLVVVNDQELEFWHVTVEGLTRAHQLRLTTAASGMLPVDLFEVDAPSRPKLPASVAELMIEHSSAIPAQIAEDAPAVFGGRHDTLQELLLWGQEGVSVITTDGTVAGYRVMEEETGLEPLQEVLHIATADWESDGDLDLLVVTTAGIHMMQNNGNRTFQDISKYSQMPPEQVRVVQTVACDIDRDLDPDFMLVSDGPPAVLENIQHGQFRYRSLESDRWPSLAGSAALAIGDFDHNGSWDFLATSGAESQLTLTRNSGPERMHVIRSERFAGEPPAAAMASSEPSADVAVGDLNNDGHLDLLLASSTGLQARMGIPQAQFAPAVTLTTEPTNSLSLIDRNYEGKLDILAIVNGQPTVWSAPSTAASTNFVDVRLTGINDINGGGRINHYGIGSTLELWGGSTLFMQMVQTPVTHFGLGENSPENLRVIFTNGLTQNVEDVLPNTLVEEKQLLRGSCPYVYGWDGERFQLITDLLWNAPLGLQIARGQTLPDRRWEYLMLPGELVQPRQGKIELRVTEELWEVAYFDHILLTAVDHPAEQRLFTNEKVGPAPLAEPQLFTAEKTVYPLRAFDTRGRDKTSTLQSLDRQYLQPFDIQICQGLCEPHFVELDFGELPTDEHLRLFLNGWMYPTDTSLNIGIGQNPLRNLPEPPSLWVVDQSGQWVCAQPFMGFPGGKPKSIVVDLQGIFPTDDHRLRIAGSQQIYWDEAFVSWDSTPASLRQQTLPLESADLHYRGFSQFLPREPDQPHWFDYQAVSQEPNWPQLDGPFTRYGDVKRILASDDDAMVVMTSGDEIQLTFSAPSTPLPAGWQRDYILHSTGWDKDADINTLHGQGSLPLPFKSQLAYPATLEQAAQAQQVWDKNSATLTRSN
ncbi:CRTAC1 family protein [Aureliella helgolandensis]|uniref:FG-GAP repeat protein n=1 Tax=Aureliella helgolandensis TaxID=2527968 RepID=A0A518GGF3_9BACT|nr:CRTAC1 family protein [Aureliella helgolandensis]QDV27682.1 hypothetical protein Q31a_60750 [Aureliella helgolandensis]